MLLVFGIIYLVCALLSCLTDASPWYAFAFSVFGTILVLFGLAQRSREKIGVDIEATAPPVVVEVRIDKATQDTVRTYHFAPATLLED